MLADLAFAVFGLASTQGSVQGELPLRSPLSIETVPFPLFAVEDSGITGQFQLVQTDDGGTLHILTVDRLGAGEPYSAAVYPLAAAVSVGTCGPDRPGF